MCSSDALWTLDTAFFPPAVLRSNRIAGLLIATEALTHYTFVRSFGKKTGRVILEAFDDICSASGRKAASVVVSAYVQTDRQTDRQADRRQTDRFFVYIE